MKKILFLLIAIIFFKTNNLYTQNDEVSAAAGAFVIAGIAAMAEAKEAAELEATQHILSNYPNMTHFSVKAISFTGTKLKDMSSASIIPYEVYEFEIRKKSDGRYDYNVTERYVLIGYAYPGFINEYGISYDKVFWELIDKDLWFKRMEAYVKSSSYTTVDVAEALKDGYIVKRGVTEKGSNINSSKLAIEFYDLDGDSYIVSDYSDNFKYIYNENSLGMLNIETGVLSQIKRKTIIEISKYLKKPVNRVFQ